MKILLADDEPLARSRLNRLLAEIPEADLVGEVSNGLELVSQARALEPDVVLLDIHMPGLDGLQAAHELKSLPLPPAVVFVTAYSEHALSAFDTAASGYLLKPVRREQLAEVLRQCRRPRRAQITDPGSRAQSGHLLLRRGQRQYRIAADSIRCCLADQKLTRIIHDAGEDLSELSLQELERQLGEGFLRVHRSALVAVKHIRGLSGGSANTRLQLAGYKADLPVSRRRLPAVRRLLQGRNA